MMRIAWGRAPSDEEIRLALEFVDAITTRPARPDGSLECLGGLGPNVAAIQRVYLCRLTPELIGSCVSRRLRPFRGASCWPARAWAWRRLALGGLMDAGRGGGPADVAESAGAANARTCRPGPSGSSISSPTAGRRRSIRSIPSRRWRNTPARSCRAATCRPSARPGRRFPRRSSFKKYGQSGIEVSELFPHVAENIDDIAVIRSMVADIPNHEPSLLLMNCGEARLPRPSMGSWLTYGLGSENQNLPGFVAMCPGGLPIQGAQNWQSAFLPGIHQGTYVDTQHTGRRKADREHQKPARRRRCSGEQLDLLQAFNREHLERSQGDRQLEARIQSFELAYRMQSEAAEAFDVSREPQHVLDMYGPGAQARQILIARRLVERGVRFVQVWHGARPALGLAQRHRRPSEAGRRERSGDRRAAQGS